MRKDQKPREARWHVAPTEVNDGRAFRILLRDTSMKGLMALTALSEEEIRNRLAIAEAYEGRNDG